MTKRFAIMLMLILPLMAGCLTDSGGDDDDNDNGGSGSANVTASQYLPLKTGATYNFTETEYSQWYTEPYVSTYVSTIASQKSILGKSYYTMLDQYESWTDTTYVRVADNTFYMLESFWGVLAAKHAKLTGNAISKTAEDIENLVEVPFVKFSSSSWTIYTGTTSNEYHTTQMTWKGKYIGKQSVTVPAGTFENCEVFELTMKDDTTFIGLEEPYTETFIVTMTVWLAPNVGVVKSSSDTKISDLDGEMEDYGTSVAELTSYNIP